MTRRSISRSAKRRPINLSRGAFRQLAAALGVVFLASSAFADWSLTAADFSKLPHLTINTWSPEAGLSATNNDTSQLTSIPTRDIVSLSSGRVIPADAPTRHWQLTLRNGDTLFGEAEKFSGQSLIFKTPELGELPVPLKSVISLTNPALQMAGASPIETPSGPRDKDVVRLAHSSDRLEGIITGIDEGKVQVAVDGADTPTELPISSVGALFFAGVAPARDIPPLSLRLTFVSGTVYTLPISANQQTFTWTLSKLSLKDRAGGEHSASTDLLVSAEILGGRVVYLTELDPTHEEQVSFLGNKWPAQMNKNVLGGPLRVARNNYDHGIGVHTQSLLAYDLDGSFDTLTLRVGLDDSSAPYGEASASIILDGKTLWKADTLKPGDISPPLELPIAGGKHLELHADPAARLDVLGRVDWLNVALKRK